MEGRKEGKVDKKRRVIPEHLARKSLNGEQTKE